MRCLDQRASSWLVFPTFESSNILKAQWQASFSCLLGPCSSSFVKTMTVWADSWALRNFPRAQKPHVGTKSPVLASSATPNGLVMSILKSRTYGQRGSLSICLNQMVDGNISQLPDPLIRGSMACWNRLHLIDQRWIVQITSRNLLWLLVDQWLSFNLSRPDVLGNWTGFIFSMFLLDPSTVQIGTLFEWSWKSCR